MMNGWGRFFALYWDAKTGKLYGLNASGWAPKALTIEHLKARDHLMPQSGIDSVTVPAWSMVWTKLHDRFGASRGARSSARDFLCGERHPVPEMIHDYWKPSDGPLRPFQKAAACFCPATTSGDGPNLPQS